MTRKEILKHYRVTEKQVGLLQLVAKHRSIKPIQTYSPSERA